MTAPFTRLQIAVLLPAHELERRGHTLASIPLLALLIVDSFLFCLFGPTPWTPLGNLATLLVWPRRGSIAPLLPYKVTFAGLYLLMNAAGLACRISALQSQGEEAPPTLAGGTNTTADAAAASSPLCDLVQSDGLIWTMVNNSIFLAAFRF